MKKFSILIQSMQLFADGGAVLICAPTEHNPKGNYRLNAGQVTRLANRCGAINGYVLKLLISFGGAKYTGESVARKAGETWINPKTKATGIILKDHFATQNDGIELSMVATLKLTDVAIKSALELQAQGMVAAPAVQRQPEPVVNDGGSDDNATVVEPTVVEPTV